jgi:hypothetical protein
VNQSRATEDSTKTDVAAGSDISIPPPEVPRPEASRPHETGGPTGPEPTGSGISLSAAIRDAMGVWRVFF